mgnify:CR=1 FL=1
MAIAGGVPFHGEFSSADATALSEANARFALYGQGGTTALALNANDYVMISQITVSSAATTALAQVYDGADNVVDAGEEVHGGIVPTNSTVNVPILSPHCCQKGTYPKFKASAAGNVRAQIRGTIYRSGA